MKIKLQINGESTMGKAIEDLEKYGMKDSEYEVDMEISNKGLEILENMLDRLLDTAPQAFFNYHIIIK